MNLNDDNIPILLVEDDEVDTEAVRRLFKSSNITNPLYTATDGVRALEMIYGQNGRDKIPQPWLMLLDINMPRMNGLQLLQKLREDEKYKQSVVFILTTSDRREDKSQAYDLNVAGYLLKKNLRELGGMLSPYCRINQFPPAHA